MARPLTLLTREDVQFHWNEEQQQAYQALKDRLLSEPVLKAPDFGRSWFIISDACDIGIAAWLGQKYAGSIHPVAFFSRQLRRNELGMKRDAMDLEVLTILEALKNSGL